MKKFILSLLLIFFIIITGVFSQSGDKKPIVAVLDLQAVEVSESEARAVTNLLIPVIHSTDLVQVIDRNQREEILNEISFSLSGCADDSCALEIGKLLAADILITGSLSKVGSRISIELKALSIEEGSILETTFKIFNSVDEVVDNIDSVGATLIQNVTGKKAAQREILEYEDLVTLTITSKTEDASVIINGTPVGRIRDGQMTKALNRNIDVIVRLEHPRSYPQEQELFLDTEKSIDMKMEPRTPVTKAVKISSGGGTMASVYWRWYPVPNMMFIDIGTGWTVQDMDIFYLKELLIFKSGYYFNRENNLIRPYGGISTMYPFFDWMVSDQYPGFISFFSSNPDDDNNIKTTGDSILEALDFGLLLGVDFAFTDYFYLGIETNLFINTLFQTSNFSLANMFLKPFSISNDPMIQFGLNAEFLINPPYFTNHPDAINVKGRSLFWRKQEYKPDFFNGHRRLVEELESLPDIRLNEDIMNEIKRWKTGETVGLIAGLASGAIALGLGTWSLIDGLANENFNEAATYGAAAAGGLSLAVLLGYQLAPVPEKLIDTYNRSLGGEG